MKKDSRESASLYPITADAKFTVDITVDNYCDADTLSTGTLTLEDPLV